MISTKSALLACALLGLLPVASWAQSQGSAGFILAQQDQQGKPGEKPGQKKPDEHHPPVGNKPGQPGAPAAQGQPSESKQPTAQTPTPSGQQGQQGQETPGVKLAELQKQIVVATWKLQQQRSP